MEAGERVAVGLGSNLGDRAEHLASGVRGLAELASGLRCSRVFETDPVGGGQQRDYLNLCCVGRTDLAPAALLARMREIEEAAGRRRAGPRWGSRTLDLDLLLFGDRVLDRRELRVPHPRMTRRAFVLVPLAEIAADWEHPGEGRTIGELARRVEAGGAVRAWTGPVPAPLSDCGDGGAGPGSGAR